jgi:hypothetical protein
MYQRDRDRLVVLRKLKAKLTKQVQAAAELAGRKCAAGSSADGAVRADGGDKAWSTACAVDPRTASEASRGASK